MIFFSPPPSPHSMVEVEQLRELLEKPVTGGDRAWMLDLLERIEEQYKHLENELDDMTGQFCNAAIHLTRAEDRVRELEEQLQTAEGTSEVLASHLAAASEKITGLEETATCHHVNVTERPRYAIDDEPGHYLCLDCGDKFPLIGDTDKWEPGGGSGEVS